MNLTKFNEVTTMSSLALLDVINRARKEFNEPEVENSHFLKRVEDELEDELGLRKLFVNPTGGRPKDYYDLTLEQCTLVGMRESKGVRRAVLSKLKELESATPKLPTTLAEALRLAADLEEQKQLALIERDEAIRTKAEIGTRREATAMATAAAATKKVTGLEIELDKSKGYATIKRMEMLYHGQKFNWRLLKAACQDLGVEPINVFDANYGSVKSYPEAAWVEAYALNINTI